MRQNNQNGKRSRGRTRRPSGYNQPNVNRNTTFESNGPEGKLRGNAQQLFEKYTALAQDANSAGERISAEAFSQFADHYYRVQQTILAAIEQKRINQEARTDHKPRSDDGSVAADTNGTDADGAPDEGTTATNSEQMPDAEISDAEISDADPVNTGTSNTGTPDAENNAVEAPQVKVNRRKAKPSTKPSDDTSDEAVA